VPRTDQFTWAVLKAHNNGRGTVKLRSTRDVEINFHYFNEGNDTSGEDLQSVVEGVKFVRRMTEQSVYSSKPRCCPVLRLTKRRNNSLRTKLGHHACGTCKIGRLDDKMAVLDSNCEHELASSECIRVSFIPGFFIVTPIYMISEKASDVILKTLTIIRRSEL